MDQGGYVPIPDRSRGGIRGAAGPLRRGIRRTLDSMVFKVLSFCCILVALFGGGLSILMDWPDEISNRAEDVVMSSVMAFFVVDVIMRCIAETTDYAFSLFFWMDVIGTLSMVFEISFLLGASGKMHRAFANYHITVVRGARTARIGARAGRLSRPVRMLSFLLRDRKESFDSNATVGDSGLPNYTAKILGRKLTEVCSSKVALLTVVLVVGTPLFNIGRYPEEDFSIQAWSYSLEMDYSRDYHNIVEGTRSRDCDLHFFKATVEDMKSFYTAMEYRPFRLDGYQEHVKDSHGREMFIPGESLLQGKLPNRRQNILRQEVSRCHVTRPDCEDSDKAAIYFDFRASNQWDTIMDMGVITFIILCMGIEACDLSYCVDKMMVQPMEKMFDMAEWMGHELNEALEKTKGRHHHESFRPTIAELTTLSIETESTDEEVMSYHMDIPDEIDMLQGVFTKVIYLTKLFIEESVIEDRDVSNMDDISMGIIHEMAGKRGRFEEDDQEYASLMSPSPMSGSLGSISVSGLRAAGLNEEELRSWHIKMYVKTAKEQQKIVTWISLDSDLGVLSGQLFFNRDTFQRFVAKVCEGYTKTLPFTTFVHATDVVACSYRLLRMARWDEWMEKLLPAVLLVAAVGHDIGHRGFNNAFIIESGGEHALRYNDKSPLENLACAMLFEIMAADGTNVFGELDRSAYKQARWICIEAILNTDSTRSSDLLRDIKKVYGMAAELCDVQASKSDGTGLSSKYVQVLQDHSQLWVPYMLHLADMGSQLHTFEVCHHWALLRMEELFLQGDEEKRLNMPVGALNDRSKVNIASAQYSFINVLMSPMVSGLINALPMMKPLNGQMLTNLETWHQMWLEVASPTPVEKEKRGMAMKSLRKQMSMESRISAFNTHSINGRWTCLRTWGLSEFLKASKVSYVQRKAAENAPSPTWEFNQVGDHIIFTNHTVLGPIKEEFTCNGEEYHMVDGWKQRVCCKAYWEGVKLVIERERSQGTFREERWIDDDGRMQFTLESIEPRLPVKWGRTFEKLKVSLKMPG